MQKLVLLSLSTLALTFSGVAEAKKPKNADDQNNADHPNNFRPKKNPTLGLGVGISVPSNQLDTFILRARISPDLTLEPMLNFGSMTGVSTSTITMDEIDPATGASTGNTTTSSTTTTSDTSWMGAGLGVRYRVAKRGNTDLQGLLGAGYGKQTTEDKTDGVQGKNTSESSTMSLNVGLGMENFFAPKWSAGFDVTTPVYTTLTGTTTPIDTSVTAKTETDGTSKAFSPSFRLMLTHYF